MKDCLVHTQENLVYHVFLLLDLNLFILLVLRGSMSMKIIHWDMELCPSYRGVRLIKVFLCERHLISAGTYESVRLREVSVLWDVRLKRFQCKKIRKFSEP